MKCTFCGDNIEQGTGKMLVKNDGRIFYYCSSKCEKNMLELKRDSKKVNWIRKSGKEDKKTETKK